MSDCGCEIEIKDQSQRGVLIWLLSINLGMFFLEIVVGWYAESTALIADALDMLADAIVYGISLYAVGRSAHHKVKAALVSGYFQGVLGLTVLIDIGRRIILGSEPESFFNGLGFPFGGYNLPTILSGGRFLNSINTGVVCLVF